jgi:hypothetical protein
MIGETTCKCARPDFWTVSSNLCWKQYMGAFLSSVEEDIGVKFLPHSSEASFTTSLSCEIPSLGLSGLCSSLHFSYFWYLPQSIFKLGRSRPAELVKAAPDSSLDLGHFPYVYLPRSCFQRGVYPRASSSLWSGRTNPRKKILLRS